MTLDTPDKAGLERLIAQAFESLPPPDPARLDEIAERLTQRPVFMRKRALAWLRYWWLVIALAGAGAATATWWVLDYPLEEEPEPELSAPLSTPPVEPQSEIPHEPRKTIEQATPHTPETPESAQVHEPGQSRDPVIYQRQR